MNYQLKVNGIYDQRTLETVVSMGVKHFGFCFKALSPNLVPTKLFFDELLPKIPFGSFLYFEFENQLDPMIKYLSEKLSSRDEGFQSVGICLTKLTGSEQCLFNSNQVLGLDYDLENWQKNSQIKKNLVDASAISVKFIQVEQIKKEYKINDFFQSLNHFAKRDALEIELKLSVDTDFTVQDIEFFDFNRISLEINPELEVCFRNVNLEKLTRRLLELKEICN